MPEYVHAPIEVNADDFKAQAFDYLRARIEGWEPSDGQLDVWLIEAVAEIAAQVGEAASDVVRDVFRYYGRNVVSLPPREAAYAEGTTSWTVVDDTGWTIPAGTVVAFEGAPDRAAFETVEAAVVPPGTTTVSGIPVVASEPGASGSALTGFGELIDPLDFVVGLSLDEPTFGGEDAEPEEEYFSRLVAELRLLAPRPILPADFAVLARRVPGVERTIAVDMYDPIADTWDNERTVCVFAVGPSAEPLTTDAATGVRELLEAQREANFVVHVAAPTTTAVDVAFRATAWPGRDLAAVEAQARAAVEAHLDPRAWGQPDSGDTLEWHNDSAVRYLEVASVLNGVEGLRHVEELTLNGGTADVPLDGVVSLPQPGAISGEVLNG